ncbi:hypothetical protein Psesu_2695 [Pseudoxanthomonas suwonensis 11-1]|uniref:Secreted protein n=1 Tax=Pseudoxanthomonas suwonensis (strain 11-1) TaxID=743721 RepID=E6WW32_PSEUU|nr:hypothetical protein [Pseudoxanthomonas suwonensis]ADV28523.1 hypothetical protein Psesu_2695 [Pseudoxanthomonas suwonensis 11-1]
MTRPMILVASMAAAFSLAACGRDAGPETTDGGTIQAAHTVPAAPATASADSSGMPTAGAGAAGAASADAGSASASASAAASAGSGSGDGVASPDRYPAAQRTCVAEVARLSSTPENELVVTGTARTQAGVEVRVQRQELRSAWTCQTDAQGETLLGVQDGRAAG